MAALPPDIVTIPSAWVQFLELLFGILKMGVAWFEDSWRSSHERLLRRDAIHPALLGKLFMIGKTEAEKEFDGFIGFWSFGFVVGFSFAFCLRLFGFCGNGFGGGRAVGSPLKIVEQLFVESKSLLPGFQFVAG